MRRCFFLSFLQKGIQIRQVSVPNLGDFLSEENDLQKMQEQQAQQQEMEERKRVMVRSILEPEARRHGVWNVIAIERMPF